MSARLCEAQVVNQRLGIGFYAKVKRIDDIDVVELVRSAKLIGRRIYHAQMTSSKDDSGYVLIHLGRRNAGPRILEEVARSLLKQGKLRGLIFSCYADNLEKITDLETKQLPIRTYTNKITFITSLLLLPMKIWKIDHFLKQFRDENLMFVMHHAWDPLLFKWLNKNTMKRKIYWIHDPRNHEGESKILNRALVNSALKRADVIVTLSSQVTNDLKERAHDLEIIQISHPVKVNSAFEELAIRSSHQVLFLGRISKYKGLGRLCAAWPIVLESIPTANLVIAGDGDHELVRKASANLSNFKAIVKYLSDDEISHLMLTSGLLVLPYDEASQSGILVKAIEYAIPYVATPVGALVEQNLELGGGVIVKDLKPRTLALGIIESLLNSRQARTGDKQHHHSYDNQIRLLDLRISEIVNE